VAWNDDISSCGTDNCLSASGGGASTLFTKPSWQTGVPGIPSDGKRDVPDIALYSSPNYPGYLFCSSDETDWSQGQVASCNSGFRDSATGDLTVAGGTSFAAPIFAGMVAIINQKANYVSGQGLINPSLYKLAANSATYASAFHDITSGNNDCTAGSTYCSSTAGFSAGTGYDQVTGLGSIDLGNLTTAWSTNTGASASLVGTTTMVSATNATPLVNTADTFTITVSSDTGSTIPTGTLTLVIDGGPSLGGPANATATLQSNGTATYSATFTTAGTHQVLAQYPGDSTHAASTGVSQVTIGGTSSGKGSITLAASPATLDVTQGNSGTETLTVTPAGGYTGTVLLNFDFGTSGDNTLANLCYNFASTDSNGDGTVTVTGTAAASTQLIFDTNASDCASAAPRTIGGQPLHRLHKTNSAANHGTNRTNPAPMAVAFAGLLLVGFMGRYSRKFSALAGLVALVAIGLTVSACGGGSSNTTVPNPPKGTYTATVTGQDSVTATITGTTTFTFVIQ
jgi:hypothetical protein